MKTIWKTDLLHWNCPGVTAQVSPALAGLYRSASSLRILRPSARPLPFRRPADWKSAIQQVGNLRYFRCGFAAPLFLGLALLLGASASAQELLKNGNFESPFPGTDPTNNWTLVFVDGGPGDFAIAGQSTEASTSGGGRGAHLRPNNFNYAHAYFRQVVTNVTEGANYQLTCKKMQAGFQNYIDNGKLQVYMVAISGSTTNVVYGNADSVGPYSLTIIAEASHKIEVQLHLWKSVMSNESSEDMKHAHCSGWFDDFSLKLSP